MVKRTDLSRARVRIAPNTDPTKAIDFLYDNPIEGSKRTYGKPLGSPDGLVSAQQYKKEIFNRIPQDPDSGPGGPNPGANGDTGGGWLRGMGSKHAEGRPGFDKGYERQPAKSLGGGKDCWKSPFSVAGRNFK